MIRKLIKIITNLTQLKWVKVAFFVVILVAVVGLIGSNAVQKRQIKQMKHTIALQDSTINNLSKINAAEVQCTVELNIKNNKNGVVVLDANQTASKIGEQVKAALNKKQ